MELVPDEAKGTGSAVDVAAGVGRDDGGGDEEGPMDGARSVVAERDGHGGGGGPSMRNSCNSFNSLCIPLMAAPRLRSIRVISSGVKARGSGAEPGGTVSAMEVIGRSTAVVVRDGTENWARAAQGCALSGVGMGTVP